MAFPWLQQETFDDATRGGFDSETDASSILDFPDFRDLARFGYSPWQGAHALRLTLAGTATANITETAGFDTALGGTISVWMPVLLTAGLTLNDGDAVILFALQSAGPVNEAVIGVRRNGTAYEFFCGETGATRTLAVTRSNSQWYQLEMVCTIDAGAGNDGTIDFYVDGGQVGAQITALDQAAIAQAQLGAVSGTAAGNSGVMLVGGIIADDVRVYPRERFPVDTLWVTRDMNAFIGPCTVDSVVLTGTGTDAILTALDAAIYTATGLRFSREPVIYVRNVTANDGSPGQNLPMTFRHGVYVQLTGTNPQAWISLDGPRGIVQSHAGYIHRGLAAP